MEEVGSIIVPLHVISTVEFDFILCLEPKGLTQFCLNEETAYYPPTID